MDSTVNRGYLLPSQDSKRISLNLFHEMITNDLTALDKDVATCIDRIEINAIFATGVTSGKIVYRDTDNSYKLAIADNTGKDIHLGVSNIEDNYVFASGIVPISQAFSIGDALFLSDITAGELTTDNTGVFLGFYRGGNKIFLYPKIELPSPVLYGATDIMSFSPDTTLPLINYTNKNLDSLNNTAGTLTAGASGKYKLDCSACLESNTITDFEYDLILSITNVSDKVIHSGKFSKSTANFNISSVVARDLLKGNNASLKLKLYGFVGIIQLTVNDIVFKMEKI